MALAHFDWAQQMLTFASVGNIETRVFNSSEPIKFVVRRGIVGGNAPDPIVTQHHWEPSNVMVMHSDGLSTHWNWADHDNPALSATELAVRLLRTLAKDDDDATVLIVREAPP